MATVAYIFVYRAYVGVPLGALLRYERADFAIVGRATRRVLDRVRRRRGA